MATVTHGQQTQGDPDSLGGVLNRILTKARRFTRAEAGTIYVREEVLLRSVAVQNDVLAGRLGDEEVHRRLSAQPLDLRQPSLAAFAGLTGRTLNVHDAYRIAADRPYRFDRTFDGQTGYRTVSVFAVPIRDAAKTVLGVIELINALDPRGRPVPFRPPYGYVEQSLVSYAVAAIRAAEGRGPNGQGPEPSATEPRVAPAVARRLGELLLSHRLITEDQLRHALSEQNRSKEMLGAILVSAGAISEDQLVEFLARQYGLSVLHVPDAVDPEVLRLVPEDLASKHELVPLERDASSLVVAMADPTNLAAADEVAFHTGLRVVPGIAPRTRIRRALEEWYRPPPATLDEVLTQAEGELPEFEILEAGEDERAPDLVELRSSSDQAPVVRIVNSLILDAIRRRASDIHLEPFRTSLRVRFRIDGALQQVMAPPKRLAAAITSRIKIMADLDIAEHRRPQDGHIRLRAGDLEVDLRVATVPTVFGESVILRVLDRSAVSFDPAQLGFDAPGLDRFSQALRAQHGLVLITGPTGSGKTTTLYAALNTLNSLTVKIATIEDPVEYQLEGVNQVQVNEEIGRTFPATLRSLLRSDPDVIMLGEMRDAETIQTAIRAALTGHLVLSTLHTNDGPSTVVRLIDMGIPPFLVASALKLIVAQRLVRLVCSECGEPYETTEDSLVPHGHRPTGHGICRLMKSRGCPACNFTGFKGRVAIYELMPATPTIRGLIGQGATPDELRCGARKEGMVTLRESALLKVMAGVTTVEEVLRVTAD